MDSLDVADDASEDIEDVSRNFAFDNTDDETDDVDNENIVVIVFVREEDEIPSVSCTVLDRSVDILEVDVSDETVVLNVNMDVTDFMEVGDVDANVSNTVEP